MYTKNPKIKLFSILALALIGINCLSYFFHYEWKYDSYSYSGSYSLAFYAPSFKSFFYMLCDLAVPLTLMLFAINSYEKESPAPFKAIMYITLAAVQTIFMFKNITDGFSRNNYEIFLYSMPLVAASVFCILAAFKNSSNKLFAILIGAVGLGMVTISIFETFDSLDYYFENFFYFITTYAGLAGTAFLYMVHLFLGLEVSGPISVSPVSPVSPVARPVMDPAKQAQLDEIQRMYQLGYLDANEYEQKRREIMSGR